MLMLTGEYELVLDEKNRLSIPARVREQIIPEEHGSGFYLIPGANRILNLYPDKYYQRIALAVAPRMAAPDELLAYERVNFALAGRVELDRQGRVLIAEKMLKRAQLTEQVMLVGVRDHLELWDVEQWGRFVNEHLAMHEQKLLEARAETLRQERESAEW